MPREVEVIMFKMKIGFKELVHKAKRAAHRILSQYSGMKVCTILHLNSDAYC